MYTLFNFKTKKALRAAIAEGKVITVFNPGPIGKAPHNGTVYLEGPHYPAPHTWYAEGVMADGKLVSIK